MKEVKEVAHFSMFTAIVKLGKRFDILLCFPLFLEIE